jgi:hypothetical protein
MRLVVFCRNCLSIGHSLAFTGNANVKFRFLLSALIAAFLVVGTAAHGATHDYAPEVGQELVDCQGCHIQSSEAEELDLEYFFSAQTPHFPTSAQVLRPNSFGHYQSRAPPKF